MAPGHPPWGAAAVKAGILKKALPIKGGVLSVDGDPCLPPGLVIGLALPLQVQGPEPQVHVLRPLPVPPPPGLAGQCGDSGVQVGVVPLEGQLERRSVPLQAGDGGVVAVAQAVPLLRRDALDPRQSLPDGGAVAEHRHRLVRVGGGDAAQGPLHPLPQLPQPLSTGAVQVGSLRLKRSSSPGWVRRTWPQVWSSQSPCSAPAAPGRYAVPGPWAHRQPGPWCRCGTGRWTTPRRSAPPGSAAPGPGSALRPFSVTRASYQPWMRRYRFPSASAWRIR